MPALVPAERPRLLPDAARPAAGPPWGPRAADGAPLHEPQPSPRRAPARSQAAQQPKDTHLALLKEGMAGGEARIGRGGRSMLALHTTFAVELLRAIHAPQVRPLPLWAQEACWTTATWGSSRCAWIDCVPGFLAGPGSHATPAQPVACWRLLADRWRLQPAPGCRRCCRRRCRKRRLQGARHCPASKPCAATPLQNLLGLAIAVLLIAYNYVTAAPRRVDQ